MIFAQLLWRTKVHFEDILNSSHIWATWHFQQVEIHLLWQEKASERKMTVSNPTPLSHFTQLNLHFAFQSFFTMFTFNILCILHLRPILQSPTSVSSLWLKLHAYWGFLHFIELYFLILNWQCAHWLIDWLFDWSQLDHELFCSWLWLEMN